MAIKMQLLLKQRFSSFVMKKMETLFLLTARICEK